MSFALLSIMLGALLVLLAAVIIIAILMRR